MFDIVTAVLGVGALLLELALFWLIYQGLAGVRAELRGLRNDLSERAKND